MSYTKGLLSYICPFSQLSHVELKNFTPHEFICVHRHFLQIVIFLSHLSAFLYSFRNLFDHSLFSFYYLCLPFFLAFYSSAHSCLSICIFPVHLHIFAILCVYCSVFTFFYLSLNLDSYPSLYLFSDTLRYFLSFCLLAYMYMLQVCICRPINLSISLYSILAAGESVNW